MEDPSLAPGGYDRVRAHTPPAVNERIDRLTLGGIEATGRAGASAIVRRLEELDREWDIDRAVMASFTTLGGASFAVGLSRYVNTPWFDVLLGRRRKGWLYVFATQVGFLATHAVNGWCPPASVLRRLGYRTAREIEVERRELEAMLATLARATSVGPESVTLAMGAAFADQVMDAATSITAYEGTPEAPLGSFADPREGQPNPG